MRSNLPFARMVLAVLVCAATTAGESVEDSECCSTGFVAGQLLVKFAPGLSREAVEGVVEDVRAGVIDLLFSVDTGSWYRICVPVREEHAFLSTFLGLPEVVAAEPNYVFCIPDLPPCECCPAGVICDIGPCDPDQDLEDGDGDGLGDICDPCTDTDDDGFGDLALSADRCKSDNCPGTFNPDQADVDGDGIGDLCENQRTCICHIPPGDPDGAHTVCVNVNAVRAHLAHGDVEQPCEDRLIPFGAGQPRTRRTPAAGRRPR